MNREWQKDLEIHTPTATAALPPATIEEVSWDILLALRSDPRHGLSLQRLAAVASVHPMKLGHWLSWLEDCGLVTGATDKTSGTVRAILTRAGSELLNSYLAAISDLDARVHH